MRSPLDRFLSRSRASGLSVPEEGPARLSRYIELLLALGDRLSLLSHADLKAGRIVGRHFADAVAGLLFAAPAQGARVLDYGAGAGVVGIPWAILRPDLGLALLESRHRKTAFLRRAVDELALRNVEVWEGRGEDPGDRVGAFDLVTSRGVTTDAETLDAITALLAPCGAALFFKGPETSPETARVLSADPRFDAPREKAHLLGDDKKRVYLLAKLKP
jgi:16S rRNA (guanine527-N7)-methyltransferase